MTATVAASASATATPISAAGRKRYVSNRFRLFSLHGSERLIGDARRQRHAVPQRQSRQRCQQLRTFQQPADNSATAAQLLSWLSNCHHSSSEGQLRSPGGLPVNPIWLVGRRRVKSSRRDNRSRPASKTRQVDSIGQKSRAQLHSTQNGLCVVFRGAPSDFCLRDAIDFTSSGSVAPSSA